METQGGKYLTFVLGREIYGIPIKRAKEIIGMMEITNLPKAHGYFKGVINLRGKIIPVVDLRNRFGMEEKPYNERTCVIIVETNVLDIQKLVGFIVDTVTEVINIQSGEIEPSPEYGQQIEEEFLAGIGKTKEEVVLLLNVDKILSHQLLESIKNDEII